MSYMYQIERERLALPQDHAEHHRRDKSEPYPKSQFDSAYRVVYAPCCRKEGQDICYEHSKNERNDRFERGFLFSFRKHFRRYVAHASPCSAEYLFVVPNESDKSRCDTRGENGPERKSYHTLILTR